MKTRLLACVAASAALIAMTSLQSGAQQPDAAVLAAAKEYVVLKGALAMFSPLVPGVIENAKNVFLQQNPALGKDLDAVAAQLRKQYEFKRADLHTEIAKIYASRFTEQELKQLVAFYNTPLGKKAMSTESAIVELTLQSAQQFGDNFSREAMEAFRVEMRKKGHSL